MKRRFWMHRHLAMSLRQVFCVHACCPDIKIHSHKGSGSWRRASSLRA